MANPSKPRSKSGLKSRPKPAPKSSGSTFMGSKLFKSMYGFEFHKQIQLKCLVTLDTMLEHYSNLDINIRINKHLIDRDVYDLTYLFSTSEPEKVPLGLIRSDENRPQNLKPRQSKTKPKPTTKARPKSAPSKQTRAPAKPKQKQQQQKQPLSLEKKAKKEQSKAKSKPHRDESDGIEQKTSKKVKLDHRKSPIIEQDILLPCRSYRDPEIDEVLKPSTKPTKPTTAATNIIPKRDKPGTAGSKQPLSANRSKSERRLNPKYKKANFIDTKGIIDASMIITLEEFSQRFGIEKVREDPLQLCKSFSINVPLYEQ